ncbi:POTRA domain-containing protein, ShlB-type [Burkholderia sp. GAS332]|nr:POTRA domain-containing protein, ShlB-type [Burkholderia sp. GAS332]
MKFRPALAVLPLATLASIIAHAQQMPTPADTASAARASAEQNQQIEQQRNAQEREATVNAPSVRSTVERASGWPELPVETSCFRIDSFVLEVPATLSDAVRAQGASALPLDRFAFAREWLDHYKGQCTGKTGLDTLTKGLQQTILSRGYITTCVLLPEQGPLNREAEACAGAGCDRQGSLCRSCNARHMEISIPYARWQRAEPARPRTGA